ncbi:hypothetical protein B296_00045911, partial [Ensete ventricosum]
AADISSGVDEQLWSMAGFMASLSATLLVFYLVQVEEPRRARRVVGPSLGPHPLRHRLLRQVQLPDRGLRVWQGGVLRRRQLRLDGVNGVCPSDLKVVAARSSSRGSEGVACMSACEAFGSPQYCCSGAYGNPNTCMPSSFSQFFKNACPKAYSYAFDDATSTFTCASADYRITFCPITAR